MDDKLSQKNIQGESAREDVHNLKRKLRARHVDWRRYEAEIRHYFENRLTRMQIVRTTKTPHGQVIDWVPRESQLRRGERLAEPPPFVYEAPTVSRERPDRLVQFELENLGVERGPEGTVPVLRKDLDSIRFGQPLRKLLGKYPYVDFMTLRDGRLTPAPSVDGPHRYADTQQRVICFGGREC